MKTLVIAAMLSSVCAWSQAKTPSTKPEPVKLYISGATCSYLDTDFDTGLPLSGAGMCMAEAHHKMKDGSNVIVTLACNMQLATCGKLRFGQTYEVEEVNPQEYPECGKPNKKLGCLKVHARPYDLIYIKTILADCKADQPSGTPAYEACKNQAMAGSKQ
jgi:hypothetical protein